MSVKQRWRIARAHYNRRSGKRTLIRGSFEAIGVVAVIFEVLALFFPDHFSWGWWGVVLLLVVGLVLGLFLSRPRLTISHRLPPTDLVVEISEMFSSKRAMW